MGKYLDALKGQKPLTQKVTKPSKPNERGNVSFVTSYPKSFTAENDGGDVDALARQLETIIRRYDASKGMSPEAALALLDEGNKIYDLLPDDIGQAVFKAIDGLGPWPDLYNFSKNGESHEI